MPYCLSNKSNKRMKEVVCDIPWIYIRTYVNQFRYTLVLHPFLCNSVTIREWLTVHPWRHTRCIDNMFRAVWYPVPRKFVSCSTDSQQRASGQGKWDVIFVSVRHREQLRLWQVRSRLANSNILNIAARSNLSKHKVVRLLSKCERCILLGKSYNDCPIYID